MRACLSVLLPNIITEPDLMFAQKQRPSYLQFIASVKNKTKYKKKYKKLLSNRAYKF